MVYHISSNDKREGAALAKHAKHSESAKRNAKGTTAHRASHAKPSAVVDEAKEAVAEESAEASAPAAELAPAEEPALAAEPAEEPAPAAEPAEELVFSLAFEPAPVEGSDLAMPAPATAPEPETASAPEPESPYGTVFSLDDAEPLFGSFSYEQKDDMPFRDARKQDLLSAAVARQQQIDNDRATPPAPHRGAETGKPRNKRDDRRRAQAALANPDIFAGLTPTGTNCPDPDDPHVRAQARANQRRRNSLQGEIIPGSPKEILEDNWKHILGVVLIVVVVVVGIFAARAFVGTPATSTPAYVSPYTWTNLDRTNGRFSYAVDGQAQSRLGVDVSENQLNIDWNAVAQDGIDFAWIRLGYRGSTEGGLYLDPYYEYNIDAAQAAGLDTGVYFFSQATTTDEAVEEARYVINALNGRTLQYPVGFDSEVVSNGRTANLSDDEMTAICQAFCQTMERAGYTCVIYGNGSDLSRYSARTLETYGVWYAEYNMPSPTATVDFYYWQYSNDGSVAGIPTAVDMNIDLTQAYENSTTR